MKEIAKWRSDSLSSKSNSNFAMSGFDDSFNASASYQPKLQEKTEDYS
jgi:hypothetical protein